MNQRAALIRWSMKTPRAAAIAGIIFSVLLISSQLLISVSVSADAIGSAREIIDHSKTISFALNLLPFAGIAFLWFIGVVRDRRERKRIASFPLSSLVADFSTLR